jgi:hypothetical protein
VRELEFIAGGLSAILNYADGEDLEGNTGLQGEVKGDEVDIRLITGATITATLSSAPGDCTLKVNVLSRSHTRTILENYYARIKDLQHLSVSPQPRPRLFPSLLISRNTCIWSCGYA